MCKRENIVIYIRKKRSRRRTQQRSNIQNEETHNNSRSHLQLLRTLSNITPVFGALLEMLRV